MIKKTLITGAILFCFLVASMNIIIAGSTTLTDPVGDTVDDDTLETVTGKENIDITQLVVSRNYRRVTLKLTVDGVIENTGTIGVFKILVDEDYYTELISSMTEFELIEFMSQDIVSYSFEVVSSADIYTIFYVNNEALIYNSNIEQVDSTPSSSGDTLTISFNLPSSTENITEVAVIIEEILNAGDISFSDDLYDEVNDPLENGGSNGGSGQDGSDSGLTIILAIIVVMIIAGIAVVVYILRR